MKKTLKPYRKPRIKVYNVRAGSMLVGSAPPKETKVYHISYDGETDEDPLPDDIDAQ